MSLLHHQTRKQLPEIRVLIVEHSQEDRISHAYHLRSWGFKPIVANPEGAGLIDLAKTLSFEHRCQIALVDLYLTKEDNINNISGFDLAKQIKPTVSIFFINDDDNDDNKPDMNKITSLNVFYFLEKTEKPQHLLKTLQSVLSNLGIGEYGAQEIIWPIGTSSATINQILLPNQPSVPDDQAHELMQRLFRGHQRIVLTPITVPQFAAQDTSAPRHHSSVFRVTIDDQTPQWIVKLARVDKIARETRNYLAFVKGTLSPNAHPWSNAQALLWDLGGIVYKTLGTPKGKAQDEVQTVATAYHAIEQQPLLKLVRRFFEETWDHWYTTQVEPLDDSLFLAYDLCWGGKLSAELPNWRDLTKLRQLAGGLPNLPDPRRWLADHHQECRQVQGTRSAVTHGDLHGDNLLIDGEQLCPIDFERTGRGPILRDFVELIQDLLTRVAHFGVADLPVFYELAVAICMPARPNQPMLISEMIKQHAEANKAFAVVQELQLLAARRTHYRDRREYLWGLLLNSLFVVRLLPEDDPRHTITLLLAAVICDRLAHWDKRTWKPINISPAHWLKRGAAQIRIPESTHALPRPEQQKHTGPHADQHNLNQHIGTLDDGRDDLRSRCARTIEELNKRSGWNLDQRTQQSYLARLLPLLPDPCSDETLRQTVRIYHFDHKLVEALCDASQPGHQAAWEDVRLRVQMILKSKGFSDYTNGAVTLDDLVQIALTDLAASLPRFRFGSRLATWLHIIALNSARRTLRSQHAAQRAGVSVPLDDSNSGGLAIPTTAHPETLADYQLLVDLISQALQRDDDGQLLRIFQLWALDDQRLLDISTELHLSSSRIQTLLGQVRATLQDYLRAHQWQDDQ